MDAMLKLAVTELKKVGSDPRKFAETTDMANYDPVSDFIDTPEMRDALGNVIMRRLRITEGLHDEEEAFERAKELMPEVRDAMHAFVAGNLVQTMMGLLKQLAETGLQDFSRIDEIVEPRVAMVDDNALAFSAEINKELLEEIVSESKDTEEKKVKFDPAWG